MDRNAVPDPPWEQIQVYEDALPPELFAEFRALIDPVSHETGDYCSKENTGWWKLDSAPRSIAERVAQHLFKYVDRSYLQDDRFGQRRLVAPVLAGAEWWARLTYLLEEHEPHFDKDERRWEQAGQGELVHPYYGSILYMGEAGGATVILDQRAITEGAKIVATDPPLEETDNCRVCVIQPKPNQYAIFPGWARHWVEPVDAVGSRRTVLYNWWCQEPWQMPTTPTYIPGEKP